MPLVVQKFGGTSLADSEKILAAARKAVRAFQDGNRVVMVVSAMGKNTDMLEKLAFEVNEVPPAREMDMLLSTGEQVSVALMAMAIHSLGYRATSLSGGQIGIKTDSSHTKARIQSIATDRIVSLLNDGNIVIVAGFQGIDEQLNITTLGRGGSDTTAVALAAVLQADTCEIYTDVDGIYTTDPRILPEASLSRQVSYDEMLELASLGAGVMHSRSIEFGKKFNVPIKVRSSLSDSVGSLIVDQSATEELPVSGAALTRDEARISITDLPDVPGTIHRILNPLTDQKTTIDMIVQNVAADGKADIAFTVPQNELTTSMTAIEPVVNSLGGNLQDPDELVSKVSIVGMGMAQQVAVASRMFRALADASINIQMITTSEIKISVLVSREQALTALRIVHNEFKLDEGISATTDFEFDPKSRSTVDAIEVVDRLQKVGMESLTIDEILLDDAQSRITLTQVPNEPGIAATLFERVAAQDIFVDMIVQSFAYDQFADISFSVPHDQCELASEVAQQIKHEFDCKAFHSQQDIAKLVVAGIGLRSHTAVAIGTFQALSHAKINVQMINTSEVRVNVVVDGKLGAAGLQHLNKHFGISG